MLVNYCTRRYVTEIFIQDSKCTIKTLDFYARESSLEVNKLIKCSEPFGNYKQVNGERIFFLHEGLIEDKVRQNLF